MTEDEMVEWYHRLNGHEFEQIPGDSEGQGVQCVHGVAELDKLGTEQQQKNKSSLIIKTLEKTIYFLKCFLHLKTISFCLMAANTIFLSTTKNFSKFNSPNNKVKIIIILLLDFQYYMRTMG